MIFVGFVGIGVFSSLKWWIDVIGLFSASINVHQTQFKDKKKTKYKSVIYF